MKQKVTIEIICFLLILLFVYAASSKLIEYSSFKIQLSNSPILKPFAAIIAWFVPAVELIIVMMLTVKNTRKYGLYASLILLMIFTLYISGMLLSEIHLPCSCGGIIQGLSWGRHLIFNLVFMALCFTGIILRRKQKQDTLIKNKNISREKGSKLKTLESKQVSIHLLDELKIKLFQIRKHY